MSLNVICEDDAFALPLPFALKAVLLGVPGAAELRRQWLKQPLDPVQEKPPLVSAFSCAVDGMPAHVGLWDASGANARHALRLVPQTDTIILCYLVSKVSFLN